MLFEWAKRNQIIAHASRLVPWGEAKSNLSKLCLSKEDHKMFLLHLEPMTRFPFLAI